MSLRIGLGVLVAALCVLAGVSAAAAAGGGAPGGGGGGGGGQKVSLLLRRRAADDKGAFQIGLQRAAWDPRQTAAIVCDMWDVHWCKGATDRVGQIAPRMNELLAALRERGGLIIHAPSDTMKSYADHPARKLAQSAPRAANLPADIGKWCRGIDAEKGATWPLDQSDGGCDCQPQCKGGHPWTRQTAALDIRDGDAITDSGEEVWNLLEARGIRNVLVMGVHTNMCVIGRPFGLRNLVRCGKNVALVRDLTDTMYNHRKAPQVSHFRGTELMIEYIEKYVCPTVLSTDVTGKPAARFAGDSRPAVAMVISEPEYRTWETLPPFAERVLADRCGLRVELLGADPANDNRVPYLAAALDRADLLFVSMRRRALPEADLAAVKRYIAAGKPVVGIRTASHAFDTKGKHPAGHADWPTFDPDVLGGNYKGHHGAGAKTTVTAAEGASGHPILAGVALPIESAGSLYRASPLAATAKALLTGAIPKQPAEPVAWTNMAGKSRVFYTSLGHPDDFAGDNPPIVRLLTNAVFWALDKPIPAPPAPEKPAEKKQG